MAEEFYEVLNWLYRKYLKWVCRRGYARVLDREKIEGLIQDVICKMREMREKARTFANSDLASPKKLTQSARARLDEILCGILSNELNDKELFDLIALQDKSPQTKVAAGKAHDVLYERHFKDLLKSVRKGSRDFLSVEEAKEIAQEVLLEIGFQKASDFKAHPDNLKDPVKLHWQVHAWLSACALNKVRDIRRKRGGVKIINAGDIKISSKRGEIGANEIGDETRLDIIRCDKEGSIRLRDAAEDNYYSPVSARTPETISKAKEFEFEENALPILHEALSKLSERDREVTIAMDEWYPDDKEKQKVLKELESKHKIRTSDHRRVIRLRSIVKLEKSMEAHGEEYRQRILENKKRKIEKK